MISKKIYLAIVLMTVGSVVSALGTVSVPWSYELSDFCKLSYFWPGVLVQVLGGMWFGWVGVASGIVFPTISNWLTGGGSLQLVGYIGANTIQSLLPYLIYRWRRRPPVVSTFGDTAFFLVTCILSMIVAGALGAAAIFWWGAAEYSFLHFADTAWLWGWIHIRALFIIGVPMMMFVAPKVTSSDLAASYWLNLNRQIGNRGLALKVFLAAGLVTALPLFVVGLYQVLHIGNAALLEPHYLALATSVGFFSLLLLTAVITDWATRPAQILINKVAELTSTQVADLQDISEARGAGDDVRCLVDALCARVAQHERDLAFSQIAERVAHDIQSPLATLEIATEKAANASDEYHAGLRSATTRIAAISNYLLEEYHGKPRGRNSDVECIPESFLATVLAVVSEKRIRYMERPEFCIETRPGSYGAFPEMDKTQLARALSNVIDNAAEATRSGKNGAILMRISGEAEYVSVCIMDNGCGIAPEQLREIRNNDGRVKKPEGHGIGLSTAISSIKATGGEVKVSSRVGEGTCVDIRLPRSFPPPWFPKQIDIMRRSTVVVLDDDETIGQLWKQRLNDAGAFDAQIKLCVTLTSTEFKSAMSQLGDSVSVCLVDYNLGSQSKESGADAACAVGCCEKTVIVSGLHDDPVLLRRSADAGFKVLPKSLAGYVPLSIIG